ncbi:MAG: SDR family oxidoreductase [Desulfococcaceae bacterium]
MEPNHSFPSEASPEKDPTPGRRLLVTGASGNLGGFLCQVARKAGWEVVGAYRNHPIRIPGIAGRRIDLYQTDSISRVLSEIRPRGVIHAGAVAGINACEADPSATWTINVTASARIARWCADHQVPLIFTSSDMVFAGDRPPYRETDPAAPICRYGEQKAEAEKAVLSAWPHAAVCRLPLMFGVGQGNRTTFDEKMIADLRAGRQVLLFRDEFRTPVDLESAAEGLLNLLDKDRGLFHLGGDRRVSRFEMGKLVAQRLGLDHALLLPVRQRDVPMAALRPADLSLRSDRAKALGYRPRTLVEGYRRMLREMTAEVDG